MATGLSAAASAGWDALVIGAGPAGAVSAAVLAARGMRTLLVERRRFPRSKVCGGCMAPAGVRALEAMGLGAALGGVVSSRVGTLRVAARGRSVAVPIEPYVTVERSRFDAALVRAAAERGAVVADGAAARVLCDDAVEISREGESARIRARVVVVADGLGGTALAQRPEFAWRIDERSPVGLGAVLGRRPAHAREGEITMVCARGGYVGAAPLGEGEWALAAALDAGAVRREGVLGALRGVFAGAGVVAPEVDRGELRGVGKLTRRRGRVALGRVLVVGDAAGYVQPLTGEGMSWAIACAARIGAFAERAAAGADVGGAWRAECERVIGARRLVCRGVCALARRPAVLGTLLRVAEALPPAGWASRRLCWRGA